MGMYGGIGRAMDYNDRRGDVEFEKQLQRERHNQNMEIGGKQLEDYDYRLKQRPIYEQRETEKYNQHMAIGKNQLRQQELTADAFAKELGWKEQDKKRGEEEYNATNWAITQSEGMLDLVHDAIRGGKDKDVLIDSFNKQGKPIVDYVVNADKSITLFTPENRETVNQHQVWATLKRKDELTDKARNEARLNEALGIKKKSSGNATEKLNLQRIKDLDASYYKAADEIGKYERAKVQAQTSTSGSSANLADIDKNIKSLENYQAKIIKQMRGEVPDPEPDPEPDPGDGSGNLEFMTASGRIGIYDKKTGEFKGWKK